MGPKVKGEKEGTFAWPSAVALATSPGWPYKVGKEMEVETSPRGTKAPQGKKVKGYLCLAISCGLGHLTRVAITR